MQEGIIRMLQLQGKKGMPFEEVPVIECIAGKGIVGDCHNGNQDRQVTLLSMETKSWMAEQAVQGLCFSNFEANIVTENLDYMQLNDGELLKTNQVVLDLEKYPKRCFDDCKRVQGKLGCKLKSGVLYAKVIQSGWIQVGDFLESKSDKNNNIICE